MKVERVKILGIENLPALAQARQDFADQISVKSGKSRDSGTSGYYSAGGVGVGDTSTAGTSTVGTGSTTLKRSNGRSRRRASSSRRSSRRRKLKLRDVTTDISAKTDKILREQDEERTDMLAYYMGETTLDEIGIDYGDAENVDNWKHGGKNKQNNKDHLPKSTVQSIAEKIEKQEDDRDEMLKYYMGETDAWEIGLSFDEIGAINEWRGLGKGPRKKLKPKPSELADHIVRHEDDDDRQDRVRYFLGEIDLADLGIVESDITGETTAKLVVETFDAGDHAEGADIDVEDDKQLVDIENMIFDEIDDLIGKDWRSVTGSDGSSNSLDQLENSLRSIC